jgi:hypothetical protein
LTRRRPDAAHPRARLACRNLTAQRGDDFVQMLFNDHEENGERADQNGREKCKRCDLTHS